MRLLLIFTVRRTNTYIQFRPLFQLLPPNFNGELVKVGYERGGRCPLKGDILAQVYSTQILQVPPGVY